MMKSFYLLTEFDASISADRDKKTLSSDTKFPDDKLLTNNLSKIWDNLLSSSSHSDLEKKRDSFSIFPIEVNNLKQ